MFHRDAPVSVLIVDSRKAVRQVSRDILRAVGVRSVLEATSFHDALEIAARDLPSAVLMDAALPDQDALRLARALRIGRVPALRRAPMILVADQPTRRIVQTARDLGIDEVLARPFSIKRLKDRIEGALHHPRPFVEATSYVGPCRRRLGVPLVAGRDRRRSAEFKALGLSVAALQDAHFI